MRFFASKAKGLGSTGVLLSLVGAHKQGVSSHTVVKPLIGQPCDKFFALDKPPALFQYALYGGTYHVRHARCLLGHLYLHQA